MSDGFIHSNDSPVDLSQASIRAQLIWASLFPLAFFGLLSSLVTSSALNQMMLTLVLQRNTAQVQILAGALEKEIVSHQLPAPEFLTSAIHAFDPVRGARAYLIDQQGKLLVSSDESLNRLPYIPDAIQPILTGQKAGSLLTELDSYSEKVVVSFAPLSDRGLGVIIEEPWSENMRPALYYQFVLVGLLILGTSLSLGMLSLSIGRIIRPIRILAEHAAGAVPGSIFRPIPTRGPEEIRILIDAFNQMVIRLAEQQSALRQFAHKALLSQEEERQRLSHELHDGTLQDLVGLTQRVELCRNELEQDPQQARRRLDELHSLLDQTLGEVRRISNALRPSILEDLGLVVAVEALCKDLRQEKPALQCNYMVSGEVRRLPADLELAIFRVVQEALSNIRKHAPGATLVQVKLIFQQTDIQAEITNNGGGFENRDMRSLVRLGHLGLAGMVERARLFGGTLNIVAGSGQDTVVTLQIPVSENIEDQSAPISHSR